MNLFVQIIKFLWSKPWPGGLSKDDNTNNGKNDNTRLTIHNNTGSLAFTPSQITSTMFHNQHSFTLLMEYNLTKFESFYLMMAETLSRTKLISCWTGFVLFRFLSVSLCFCCFVFVGRCYITNTPFQLCWEVLKIVSLQAEFHCIHFF